MPQMIRGSHVPPSMTLRHTLRLLVASLAMASCARHRATSGGQPTLTKLEILQELVFSRSGTAVPQFVVLDAASLESVVQLSPANIEALRARLGDRAGVGVASLERECGRSRGMPCARLVISRFESRGAPVRVRAVWLPPEREGQRCVSSYEATYVFETHARGTASLVEIDEIDFGSCGMTAPATPPAAARPNTRDLTSTDIVWGVTAFRTYFLADSTPIDFCGLPELFGADGVLPQDPKLPPALYATLRDCENATPESRPPLRIEVLRRSAVGDTTVIHAVTRRGWASILEEYSFTRPRLSMLGPPDSGREFPEFKIVSHVQR